MWSLWTHYFLLMLLLVSLLLQQQIHWKVTQQHEQSHCRVHSTYNTFVSFDSSVFFSPHSFVCIFMHVKFLCKWITIMINVTSCPEVATSKLTVPLVWLWQHWETVSCINTLTTVCSTSSPGLCFTRSPATRYRF